MSVDILGLVYSALNLAFASYFVRLDNRLSQDWPWVQ
jgi:hypothetical protein